MNTAEPTTLKEINHVRVVCRTALGAVWLYEGLVPKLLFIRPDQPDLVERSGLYFGTPEGFLQLLGVAQIALALWLFTGLSERLAVTIATAAMAVLIVLVAYNNPWMLIDPYGALAKDLCLIACAFAVWLLAPTPQRQH